MDGKLQRQEHRMVAKLVIGLLGGALCCAAVFVGVVAYRAHVGPARPVAQVRATTTPATVPSANERTVPTTQTAIPAAVPTTVATTAPTAPTATANPAPAHAPSPLATAVPTTAPTAPPAAAGTYWVCEGDVDAAGVVDHSLDAGMKAEGGAVSPVCEHALQLRGILKAGSGGYAFQVPVGHFAAYNFCGITVANIVNTEPSNLRVPPSRWIAVDYLQFSADWTQGAPSGTC